MLAEQSIGIGSVAVDGDDLYWLEVRPADQGRSVLVRRAGDGRVEDVTTAPHNVRDRVHEYGGGAYCVSGGVAWYSNIADGRLYRVAAGSGEAPRAITRDGSLRYADMVHDARRDRLVCVREDHENLWVPPRPGAGDRAPEPRNSVVALAAGGDGEQRVLLEGADFYAAPRLSPDGTQMCWLSWNHPDMPWDGCELWLGDVDGSGVLSGVRLVAGGREESIVQPSWSPGGVLHFVSDRTGWWNLYRLGDAGVEALTAERAEFGEPHWQLGNAHYGFAGESRIACAYIVEGMSRLGVVDTATRALTPIPLPYTSIAPWVRVQAGRVVIVAASPAQPRTLVSVDLATGETAVLRSSASFDVDGACISTPETVEFPTEHGRTAYAFFYAPRNPDHTVPDGELPPLLVRTHGGPTSATPASLHLDTQFWTTRGIAVLDVNYGGSSGYGREYRARLDGMWGVVDLDDCVNGALHMVRQGRVDGRRMAINGGSAGGYTTLCALTFRDAFATGASYFGVADLELLARDTHKFESRYLDRLVAPYPHRVDVYRERSPIHHTDRLARPVILFQGLDDRVVPPAQAQAMFDAVRGKGLPCAYIAFEGEDHGFRKADSIIRSTEGELSFYAQVFGFEPGDRIQAVQVENPPGR
jgi:dipeptidyl aminopeptidase/acylaminoacyl peptidase